MSKRKKTVDELLEEVLVPEEEQRYEVPDNWIWVRVKGIGNVKGGKRLPKGHALLSEPTPYPYLRVADFTEGTIDEKDIKYISEVTASKITKYVVSHEDVYISIAGTIGKTGIVPKHLSGANLTENAAKITDIKGTSNIFIYFALITDELKNQIMQSVVSTSQPKLALFRIADLELPLPPLNEQNRIVQKAKFLLSKIEEAKQLIEEAKETFELRRAAILDKAFRGELTKKWREQNPNVESGFLLQKKIISELKDKSIEVINEKEIPATWKVVKMGEVVQINPKKKKLEDVPGEQICTFIPMPAVSDKTGEIEQPEEREYSKVKKGYTFFEEKDVLFAKITPCMENGKAAIAKNLKNGFGFGSTEFHVLRTSECINETYIHYFVRSKKFRLEAKREMTGAVGQQRVPKEFLINYPLPLPPKEEQDVIVRTLSEIFSKDHFVEQSLHIESKLELIKQSILSKAFRGELGTNNPSEENSIELLKAILQEQVK
ncbi:restriction endonuclease subunit S [Bacillus sp. AK25]|uniref:restriction endonuclease subunit S n=1 Tax=Bacillus sp. AK25 TaxID=3373260 RepID=UPI003AA8EFBF